MKLSDFLQETKIVIKNGKAEVIKPNLNGEIRFYGLDKDRVELIQKEVFPNLDDSDNKEIVSYKLFSYLVNVENDVDLNTFIKMITTPPNTPFAILIDNLFDYMDDLFEKGEVLSKTSEKVEKLKTKLPEQPKTKQEIKNELMKELSTLMENTPKNKKRRKEIFIELAELEND